MSDTTVDDTFPAMSLRRSRKRRKILDIIGGLLIGGASILVHNHLPANSPDPGSSIQLVPSISGTNTILTIRIGRRGDF